MSRATSFRYIALLRGINVGGNSLISMANVRKIFESLGFADVKTYIQTGNALFSSKEKNAAKLAKQIEKKLEAFMKKNITVFVLTPKELAKAAARNPFEPERLDKEQRCHMLFLSVKPSAAAKKAIMALKGKEYKFHVWNKVFYFAYPRDFEGYRGIDFEKVLGVRATARTWKVVDALIKLCE